MQQIRVSTWFSGVAALILAGCGDSNQSGTTRLDGSAPATRDAAVDAGGDAASSDGPSDAGMIAANRLERRDFSLQLVEQLKVKSGFRIDAVATGVTDARMLAVGPDGSTYVTAPMMSQVVRLNDANGDGKFDTAERSVVASMMDSPALEGVHGITFHEGRVYLAAIKSVVAARVMANGTLADFQVLVSDLPDGGQHPNRTIGVGPDGLLYVSVGSDCNGCSESNSEHAGILRFNLDGTAASNPAIPQHPMVARNPMAKVSPRVWTTGLRNTLGFDWHPATHELWGVDQGTDGLGADFPPEELNHLVGGRSYGWPYCWGPRLVDPTADDPSQMMRKQQYCPMTEPYVAGVQAHSSPIAFVFYRGGQFPAEFTNDAFLVLRGSWEREVPVGYKVVRIHFANGMPTPPPGGNVNDVGEDFVTGFLIENGKAYFGRIAGLAIDATGAMLISDDTNGVIYRVTAASTADGGASPTVDGGAPTVDGGAPTATR
jgi:glucose/arabinose dehydrogenase